MLFKNSILFFVLSCTLLLFSRCNKDKITDDTYFGSKIMILGHKGMGSYYKRPGDTFESIFPAINIGADGCEVDVQITKDTVLILLHDGELNAMTTCNGRVYETTWEQVKQCKYYAFQNNIFVYSVDDIFSRLSNLNNLYFSFDSKLDEKIVDQELYQNQLLRAIKRICEKYNMSDNVFIEGKAPYLRRAQNVGLSNKLFLTGVINQANIDTALNNHFFGICTEMSNFEIDADFAHEKGLYIMAYTPNNYYSNLIAINKKIDILQTDDPISILKLFNRFNNEYIIP
ncbi:MAG: hypothetical protein GW876_09555 [Bacteroidetes bacterium]|nr:hypothetical protein [Bacteroidota bacterium]